MGMVLMFVCVCCVCVCIVYIFYYYPPGKDRKPNQLIIINLIPLWMTGANPPSEIPHDMSLRTFQSINEKKAAHPFYGPEVVPERLAYLYVWVVHFWIQSRLSQVSHSVVSEKLYSRKQEVYGTGLWQGVVQLKLDKTCHIFHWNKYSADLSSPHVAQM